MNKKDLSERDICTKFITPAIVGIDGQKKWDVMTQVREMVRSVAFIKHSHQRLHSSYLALSLKSPLVQTQILEKSKTTAQSNIFLGKIIELLIPLPPLAEQYCIVAKVDQLMAMVDKLEAHLAISRSNAEKLLKAAVSELT